MRRVVKAWAQTCVNDPGHIVLHRIHGEQKEAYDDLWPEQTVVPITITYDDGVKPKPRKKVKR